MIVYEICFTFTFLHVAVDLYKVFDFKKGATYCILVIIFVYF